MSRPSARPSMRGLPSHPSDGNLRTAWFVAAAALLVLALLLTASVPSPFHATERLSELRPMVPGDVCQAESWQATHLQVSTGGCQAVFTVTYAQNFSYSTSSGSYNFSFSVPWVAEINSSGGLVRLASPLSPSFWTGGATSSGSEVNISLNQTLNVTEASGNWTPNDTWAGSGAQWSVNNSVVGTAIFFVTFHLLNVTADQSASQAKNASYSVKFDVWVAHWPWASPSDRLGIGFQALGANNSHFEYNSSNQSLSEVWNSNNQSFVSLVFGPAATAYTTAGQPSPVSVGAQTGIFPAGTPGRESVALLTFDGAGGSYTLTYDPWVEFAPGLGTVIVPPRYSPITSLISDTVVAGALAICAIAVVVAVRGRRLRLEGQELVKGIDRIISDDTRPPKGS